MAAGGAAALLSPEVASRDLDRMIELNRQIVSRSAEFYGYTTPADFRIERRHPQLFPTNVRPETLASEQEMRPPGRLRRTGGG